MAPLHHNINNLNDFGGGDIGLNYGFSYMGGGGGGGGDLGSALGGGNVVNSILSSSGLEQWRMPLQMTQQQHQFPNFLAGLEGSSNGLYPFEGNTQNHHELITSGYLRPKVINSTSGIMTQLASVKMEDSNINLSRQFLGISNNNINDNQGSEQFWNSAIVASNSSATWSDHVSGFSSSSNTTSNHM